MSKPKFVNFHFDEYRAATMHLDCEEHGAYLLLLIHCWRHGKLPEGEGGRKNLLNISDYKWKKIWSVLAPFFDECGRNKRATRERGKAIKAIEKKTLAGQLGGLRTQARYRAEAMLRGNEPSRLLDGCLSGRSSYLKNRNITTSEYDAARESSLPVDNVDNSAETASIDAADGQRSALQRAVAASPVASQELRELNARKWKL